jgi:diguanylate cyclase (GGDEF)-like protein
MKYKILQQYLYSICIGILTSVLLISIFYLSIHTVSNRQKEKEQISVLEKFIQFKSSAEAKLNENTNLLKGYLAYFEINPTMSEDDVNEFLDKLLANNIGIIRNIGIIKDTTVIWNYPKTNNEKVIGVDLTNIPAQKIDILKVKNTLQPLFIGPINLVQGGRGFIIRLPIVVEKVYWGQISIVLDADKYMNELTNLSHELELNIAIYNEDLYPYSPFFGDADIVDRSKNKLSIEILNNKWLVAVEPLEGWGRNNVIINGSIILSSIISILIGTILFILIQTRFKLKNQVMNDYLTGVHTRNYLANFYNMIQKKAEFNNELIGFYLLDINSFKSVNDNYGHKIGDLVLIEFAKKLQSINIPNKKVFRLGGDEFLITVSECKQLNELQYIESVIIKDSVVQFRYHDISIDIIPSIGFASYPDDGKTLDQIIHIADIKMYEAKNKMKKSSG